MYLFLLIAPFSESGGARGGTTKSDDVSESGDIKDGTRSGDEQPPALTLTPPKCYIYVFALHPTLLATLLT